MEAGSGSCLSASRSRSSACSSSSMVAGRPGGSVGVLAAAVQIGVCRVERGGDEPTAEYLVENHDKNAVERNHIWKFPKSKK